MFRKRLRATGVRKKNPRLTAPTKMIARESFGFSSDQASSLLPLDVVRKLLRREVVAERFDAVHVDHRHVVGEALAQSRIFIDVHLAQLDRQAGAARARAGRAGGKSGRGTALTPH